MQRLLKSFIFFNPFQDGRIALGIYSPHDSESLKLSIEFKLFLLHAIHRISNNKSKPKQAGAEQCQSQKKAVGSILEALPFFLEPSP